MKLLRCTASDVPSLPSYKAVTVQLVTNGLVGLNKYKQSESILCFPYCKCNFKHIV